MGCRAMIGSLIVVATMAGASTALAEEPEVLMWDKMMPKEDLQAPLLMPGLEEPYAEGDQGYTSRAYGIRPVEELDGKFVKLPGFIVPLESDEGGVLSEFLLVPYFGACIHVPPPPPNQIVYVELDEPVEIRQIWEPYWIIGTIETKPYSGYVAETVYTMTGQQVEKYKY